MIEILRRFFAFCTEENRKKFRLSLFEGVIMAVCEAVKYPAIGLVLRGFLENRMNGRTVLIAFVMLLAAAVIEAAVRSHSTILQCEAGYGECADKRIEMAEHLRYLPMGYFNETSLGEITSVTTNIMEQLGDVATRVVMMTTQGLLNTAVIVALIFLFDWRIGLIALGGILLFIAVNLAMRRYNAGISAKKVQCDTTLVGQVLEYIQGIPEVKAYNLTGASGRKLRDAVRSAAETNTALEVAVNRFLPIQNIILKLTGVGILIASIRFYLDGTMELLTAVVMMIMSFLVFEGLERTGAYSSLLRVIDISVERGREVLALQPMDIEGAEIATATQNIAAEDIDFAYESRKIIDGVSLAIPERTAAAFVGPSGGGKTTLCHLIARFWDVQKGSVLLDGRNVKDYSMDSLMENFSFVFQNVYLFHDTIANNIRFGKPEASMEEVVSAAKKACCHEFISALPEGYETVIGEGGASLSGGERQRISIARAIMKDAPVIILDEATANVDPENEKDLMDAIAALTKEKTILMIAHRLKTVQNADQIFVVDRGRIVQRGTHGSLMKEDGIYRRFVDARKQAIGWKLSGGNA